MTSADDEFQNDLFDRLTSRGASVGRAKSGNLLRVDARNCQPPLGIAILSEIVKCPALRELCVRGSSGLEPLVTSLPKLTKLKMLDVENTDFSDTLLESVAKLPNLEVLNIRGTQVTMALVTRLRKQMVGTRIIGP